MREGYLRVALSRRATPRQWSVLAAYVSAGGSVPDAAVLVGIRPSTVKRHLADLRARSGYDGGTQSGYLSASTSAAAMISSLSWESRSLSAMS